MNDLLALIFKTDLYTQIASILFFALALLFIKNKLILLFTGISKKTATDFDDIIIKSIQKPLTYLIIFGSLILIFQSLNGFYKYLDGFNIGTIIYVLIVAIISWILIRILDNYFINKSFLKNLKVDDDPVVIEQTYEIAIRIFKIIVIAITILMIMQEFGLSISGLLAFGGVGGLVVGLAAKDLLSNFFGGLMIYFDRPFKVGEFIKSPDRNIEGIVESIGWRLTVVRTFSKNVLYIPNAAFANIIVENATRMTNRRINEVIGLKYDDFQKIPKIVSSVKVYLSDHQEIDQGNEPVVSFKSFSASSCDFFIYAFTTTKDWREYLRIKEQILYKVSDIIKENNASIAFPTMTIEMDRPER
ncbi:MAG: mechanosensitive ion channel family protein [Gammaproteobacteria bacterium]|nr:mechanosensitive ion channel family protein [Gammaproteobacteria bacterium]MBT4654974.1 mechanosensitive ion channel family protein [Gammaproteobacteria bacterium]MBT5116512.1 mechanosensitive ion channel family protein [Gammaproteobacteria bacterium]MBT5761541.1 mechanosensitive ion channel family protein [Gammaproteobacteria bacterium]MBT6331396.1 mechanosensitive ion channel family protein [Gammaproteobacteria bacterium]